MRSEAEIRKQVEDHLKRRLLLVLDGGLWLAAVFFLWRYSITSSLGSFEGLAILFMLGWTGIVGLHTLRTIYVELREYLVKRAIERERRTYVTFSDDETMKRKHDDAIPRLSDDGELIDFEFADAEPRKTDRR